MPKRRMGRKGEDEEEEEDEEGRCVALQLARDLTRRIFSQLDCGNLMRCSLVCKHGPLLVEWTLLRPLSRLLWQCRALQHGRFRDHRQWRVETLELREGWREECMAEKYIRGLLVNREHKRPRPVYRMNMAGNLD